MPHTMRIYDRLIFEPDAFAYKMYNTNTNLWWGKEKKSFKQGTCSLAQPKLITWVLVTCHVAPIEGFSSIKTSQMIQASAYVRNNLDKNSMRV